MSRKSLPKKDQIIWFFCTKCDSNVYVKDRDQHNECCPAIDSTTCPIIRDKQLIAARLNVQTITDELCGLNARHLNSLLFLGESVFGLCDFVLGDNVLISSVALPNGVPIVRSVWPAPNTSSLPTFASVSEEEFKITWRGCTDALITIQKLSHQLIPASTVTLIAAAGSEEINQMMWSDMRKLLAVQMKSRIYGKNNVVAINFFNKSFSFTISDLVAANVASGDDVTALTEKFKSIGITQQVEHFLVTEKTLFEFNERNAVNVDAGSDEECTIAKSDLIGGMGDTIRELIKYMNISFGNTKMSSNSFVPRTVLLYGQHGSGKTLLCDAITETADALVIKINAADMFSKYFGETEANLRGHFEKAFKHYPRPSVIVIEELSSICAKDTKEDSAKRVQMAFLNLLDDIHRRQHASRLFVIATTSNIDNVNLAVRRYGRLDVEIEIPVPDAISRAEILIKQLQQTEHNLSHDEVKTIATNSHGYIAADLSNLIAKASMHASNYNSAPAENCVITLADIQYAYGHVVPSAMKEVVIKCPNVKWSDIGGQDDLKLQLKQAIEWPLLHPEAFTRMGISPPRGVLMFGPPGCSKTMIAKALATESKVNFLSIKGPELFSMWVGESERAVRDLFHKARQVAPAIIFFDEIDAIGGERTSSASGSSVKERVLTQLLTEMDGVNALANVTIVAATNRPDLIDKAIMRPGRLDRIVYVRLPDKQTRTEIFRIKLSKMPVADGIEISTLVKHTDGYSGAEIQAICQEAAMYALEENLSAAVIQWTHFTKALVKVKPRTSSELLQLYDDYLQENINK